MALSPREGTGPNVSMAVLFFCLLCVAVVAGMAGVHEPSGFHQYARASFFNHKSASLPRGVFSQERTGSQLPPRRTLPPFAAHTGDAGPQPGAPPVHPLRFLRAALGASPAVLSGALAVAVGLLVAAGLPDEAATPSPPVPTAPKRRGRPPKATAPAAPAPALPQPLPAEVYLAAGWLLASAAVGCPVVEAEAMELQLAEERRRTKKAEKENNHHIALMVKACRQDLGGAYLAFETAAAAGVFTRVAALEHLMFRLTAGDNWAQLVRRNNRPDQDQTDLCCVQVQQLADGPCSPVPLSALQCVQRIYEHLRTTGHRTNLAAVLLARALAQTGDVWAAEAVALQEGASEDSKMFLRHFTVALTAWAARKEHWNAKRIVEAIRERGLQVTEDEYALLLEAVPSTAPCSFVEGVLLEMQRQFEGELKPGTVAPIRAYFEDNGAPVAEVEVPWDGWVSHQRLQRLDVSAEELQRLRAVLEDLARKHAFDLPTLKEWLAQRGRYDVVIDAANTAMFGQNTDDGFFQFSQIKKVYVAAQETLGLSRPLVVVHRCRLEGADSLDPQARAFLQQLLAVDALFVVQAGYDDLAWTYAALLNRCPFISNDNLCDLLFKLGALDSFDRWARQHRIVYNFNAAGRVYLNPPLPYTLCVQQLQGLWMLPLTAEGNRWLQIDTQPLKGRKRAPLPPAGVHPLLAIDYGGQQLGLAATNAAATTAEGLPSLPTRSRSLLRQLTQVAEDHGVRRILIGWRPSHGGDEGPHAKATRELAQQLHAALPAVEVQLERVEGPAGELPVALAMLTRHLRTPATPARRPPTPAAL